MHEKQILKMSAYPKLVQEFAKENFNLKFLTTAALAVSILSLGLVVYLVRRGPIVVALDGNGEVARFEQKTTDVQIASAAREYIGHRYTWDHESIKTGLKRAEHFIAPSLISAFQKALIDTVRYVREKRVRQRVYPKSVEVDLKEKKISVLADRFTDFDGLKAATEMRLELWFTSGERSVTNPWGIYMVKELEGGGR